MSHPDLMRRFHAEWTLADTVLLPPGEAPAGHPSESEGGWILGPDGRWYPVEVPKPAPMPPGADTMIGAKSGGIPDINNGWTTVEHRQGRIYFGDPPPAGLLFLSGLTGFVPTVTGHPSVGENQTDYLTYDEHGFIYAHQQASDRAPAWSPPPSIPEAADPAAPDKPALDRLNRATSLANIGIGGLKGILPSHQIDANKSYAGNVVFQVSGDDRRAVIQAAQLQYDPATGKVDGLPYETFFTAEDVNQELSRDPEVEEPKLRSDIPEPNPMPGPSPTPPR